MRANAAAAFWNAWVRATKSVSVLSSAIRAPCSLHPHAHEPFRRHAIGLLRRCRGLSGAQAIGCSFEIAVRLQQRLLAGDHAGTGSVAERFHEGSR